MSADASSPDRAAAKGGARARAALVGPEDATVRRVLGRCLDRAGLDVIFQCDRFASFERRLAREELDLALVCAHAGVNDLDGFALCERMAASGEPVGLLWLASRAAEIERLRRCRLDRPDGALVAVAVLELPCTLRAVQDAARALAERAQDARRAAAERRRRPRP